MWLAIEPQGGKWAADQSRKEPDLPDDDNMD